MREGGKSTKNDQWPRQEKGGGVKIPALLVGKFYLQTQPDELGK